MTLPSVPLVSPPSLSPPLFIPPCFYLLTFFALEHVTSMPGLLRVPDLFFLSSFSSPFPGLHRLCRCFQVFLQILSRGPARVFFPPSRSFPPCLKSLLSFLSPFLCFVYHYKSFVFFLVYLFTVIFPHFLRVSPPLSASRSTSGL